MFKYFLYKFGEFLVNRLPLKLVYRIAVFLSDAQYIFSFRDRRAVKNNLRAILPPGSNVSGPAREVFRNFGKYLVEFFRMAKNLDDRFIREKIEIGDLRKLTQILSQGKGVILLTGHIGNWELAGVILSRMGYPMTAVALPHKERPVNDLFNMQRELYGITIVPPNIAVRRCLEALKENKIVAMVADRDFGHNGKLLDLLGKKALIPKGAAIFSLKAGTPILPVFFVRVKDDCFKFIFEEVIIPPPMPVSDENKAVLEIMRKHTAVIEQKIREYPSQWMMFREFWTK